MVPFKKTRLFIIILFLSFISSCKYDLTKIDVPDWQVDLLGPLAKTDFRIEELAELQDLAYSRKIGIQELGFPPGMIPYPQIILSTVGPVEVNTLDEFESILADSAFLKLTLTNDFPFLVQKGTKINFVNKHSGSLIYSFELTEDIPKGGSYQTDIILLNTLVESSILVSATDFSSGPAQNEVLKPDDGMVFTFQLVFIKIAEALISPNISVSFSETADFNLQGVDVNASALHGKLNFFVNNSYPVFGEVQAYFINSQQSQIVDSLFKPRGAILLPAIVSNEVIMSSESKFSVPVSVSRMDTIKKADQVKVDFVLHTPGGTLPYKMTHIEGMEGILVGDLKVQIIN